ncbi:lysozyme inhibitor LprI family protein [Lacinutrix sp. 5H-3-7-4]|uniref:lysozyme inhibitor LprI family protein n=1 Tax=Lacinutrix sp. (strain 5H-3-7-4) TaxID=983544 RepID=UPI00020A3E43|nr:lysozyme inhibitor LprI family protein [Lacinutrix sp. 5H-3-7-4]AEH01884.1 hypothetical protein Lacal_2038 [Lacinutrix sp. 5H-3-7-4]
MKYLILLLFILFVIPIYSQDYEDAKRLSNLEYMKMVKNSDCENQSGTSIEQKICLNLKFKKVDSILNKRFITYLKKVKNDTLKSKIKLYHKEWVLNRRMQSEIFCEGLNSNALGIYYLWSMVNSTELRIKEIELLIQN